MNDEEIVIKRRPAHHRTRRCNPHPCPAAAADDSTMELPAGHSPPTFPPDGFSQTIISLPRDIPPAVKAKIGKLALSRTPDPNNRSIWYTLGLTRYTVDQRMVTVDQGNVLHRFKTGAETVQGNSPGEYVQAGDVRIPMTRRWL